MINLVGHDMKYVFRHITYLEKASEGISIQNTLLSTYKVQKVIEESYTEPIFYSRARLTDVCFFIRLLDPSLNRARNAKLTGRWSHD